MANKHLARIRYRIKGMILDSKKFEFRENKAANNKAEGRLASHARTHIPERHQKHPEKAPDSIIHQIPRHQMEKSISRPPAAFPNEKIGLEIEKRRQLELARQKYVSGKKEAAQGATSQKQPGYVPQYYTKKSVFHSYRKGPFFSRISSKFSQHGLPPLPILILVAVIAIAAILPIISVGILAFESREVGIYLAIQTPEGNVLKNATIFLADAATFDEKYSSKTAADGTAFFESLPVSKKFVVYAERSGKRIEVEERELIVPFRQGRKEIIIVKRTAA
ncbi:MAG: hypothetical protein V1835_03100 [Candidatus Micrarchaeota archaeon]